MNKTTEALKLAHNFCEELTNLCGKYPYINGTEVVRDAYKVSSAIREALADHVEQNLTMVADHSGDANEMVYSKPSVFDGVCCGCSKKAADGYALYCVECWEKSNGDPFAASGKLITEQDHIAEADKMVGCAYCDNPLFAGTKCNNCGRVTLAEPVLITRLAVPESNVNADPVAHEETEAILIDGKSFDLPIDVVAELFDLHLQIAALKAAQAEPVQEPVAWKHDCAALLTNGVELWIDQCPHCGKPRCAAPVERQWVDLTEHELEEIGNRDFSENDWLWFYTRAVIAAFKKKNT